MYKYNKNQIIIDGKSFNFEYKIRTVIEYNSKYIVLLEIPFYINKINNIYCLNKKANVVWQSEDLDAIYSNQKNLPFEHIGLKDNYLFASDFYGRNYKINIKTGKIEGYDIVK